MNMKVKHLARRWPWLAARRRGPGLFFWLVMIGLSSLVFIILRRLEEDFSGGPDAFEGEEGYITLPEQPYRGQVVREPEGVNPPMTGLNETSGDREAIPATRGDEDLVTVEEEAAEAGSALKGQAGDNQASSGAGEEAAGTPGPEAMDDLTVIEGIGPKTEYLLRKAGITTFAQLADVPEERLHQLLEEANLRMMNPGTWKEQAALAAAGDWDGLEKLKSQLKGGRRVS